MLAGMSGPGAAPSPDGGRVVGILPDVSAREFIGQIKCDQSVIHLRDMMAAFVRADITLSQPQQELVREFLNDVRSSLGMTGAIGNDFVASVGRNGQARIQAFQATTSFITMLNSSKPG